MACAEARISERIMIGNSRVILKIRNKIVDNMLCATAVLGVPCFAISVSRVFAIGWQPVFGVQLTMLFVAIAAALQRKRLCVNMKAALIVGAFLAISLSGMLQFGVIGAWTIFMVASPVLASLLFGVWAAATVLAVCVASVVLCAAFVVSTASVPPFDVISYLTSWPAWLNVVFCAIVCVGAILYAVNAQIKALLTALDAAQHADELRKDKLAAEELNRSQSAFLSMMSHEIRTPVTGIISMAEFLSNLEMVSEQRVYINTLLSSAKALMTILNDVLDHSKIQAGRLQLESIRFDAAELATEVHRLYTATGTENGNVLSLDMAGLHSLPVKGDPTRVRQVLGNLVANALKFTKNGEVMIRMSHFEHGEMVRVQFEVMDTGIGISDTEIKKLFKPLTQAESATARNHGGTGLGLAISKELVEMMGGEISVESRLGHGSTFRFHCLVEYGEGLEDKERQQIVAPAPMSILVVEDNAVNRTILRIGLGQRGHTITMVENGLQACEEAAGKRRDLIIMDMQMPVMDGVEATKKIRKLPKPFCDTPIIALTADAITDHRQLYIDAGLNGFLTKPIDWAAVDQAIAKYGPKQAAGEMPILHSQERTEPGGNFVPIAPPASRSIAPIDG